MASIAEGIADTPLAHRRDFAIGNAVVRPSIRSIEGPAGRVALEPRIMQVLLALADARGSVLSRDDLIREVWGGRIVGEDAVNRTIAVLRRAGRESGADFVVETIPRIGFRLDTHAPVLESEDAKGPTRPSRRAVVLAGLGGGVALLAAGAAWLRRDSPSAEVRALLTQGRRALQDNHTESGPDAARYLAQAVKAAPRNAEAWGLLAFAYRDIAEAAPPHQVSLAVRASEDAARRALELDRQQGDALAALATLQPHFGEYAEAEDRLLEVLSIAPDNFLAMLHLVPLYQGVGLLRQSAMWNERAGRADPRSPVPHYRRGLKLWSSGDLVAGDQAVDRALQLWPRHPAVWNARMMMFAYTGRAEAAAALLEDKDNRPHTLREPALELWRVSLRALSSRSPADIDAARRANLEAAPRSPGFANIAMTTLSALGELDAAFDIAFGYYLRRGPLITTMWEGAGELPVSALRWRRSMALFIPPAAPMRADPRFRTLMEDMGIARYWRERKLRPDYRIGE
jgi:DNA-binding winged helix-turn-helix (wHTH) protein/tetratricopeptide (TPR) repeat protein